MIGEHLGCLYETDLEHSTQVISFLLKGLELGEKTIYYADDHTSGMILERLRKEVPGIDAHLASGRLRIDSVFEGFLRHGVFSADKLIDSLRLLEKRALAEGFPGFRVAAEATWIFRDPSNSADLIELESKLDRYLPVSNTVLLIQYDRWAFDSAFLLDVLASHQVVATGNDVLENIYYLPPDELLERDISTTTLRLWLENVQAHQRERDLLRASEENFRTIFNAAVDAIFVLDTESPAILDANQSAVGMFGYSLEDLKRLPMENLIQSTPPFTFEAARRVYREALGGNSRLIEWPVKRRDGRPFWIEVSFKLTSINGEERLLAVVRDISQRRQVESELHASEEKYHGLYDSVRDGIVMTDMEGNIVQCNRAYLDMLGYTEAEIKAMTYIQLTPEKWRRMEEEIVESQVLVKGHSDEYEKEYIRKDGQVFPISLRVWLIRDESGEPSGMWGVVRDITEQKKILEDLHLHQVELEMQNDELRLAQQELESSRDRYVDLYDFAPIGYVSLDQNGTIQEINLTGAQLLGSERARLVGHPFVTHVADEDRGPFREHLRNCLHAAARVSTELSLTGTADGNIQVELATAPYLDRATGTTIFRTSIIDVTERKRMEEKIRASLQEKETLLREIHHRVKNNLQTVSNLISVQSLQTDDPAFLKLLAESQSRIGSISLIHEKLYQSGDLARVDFAEYAGSLLSELFRTYHIDPGQVTVGINANGLVVEGDTAITCGLILTELVSNSLKHAFPHGTRGRIDIALRRHGNELALVIGDNGSGLPEGLDLSQTKSMGLQLVNIHIRRLEGKMEYSGGQGARFTITFPEFLPQEE